MTRAIGQIGVTQKDLIATFIECCLELKRIGPTDGKITVLPLDDESAAWTDTSNFPFHTVRSGKHIVPKYGYRRLRRIEAQVRVEPRDVSRTECDQGVC